MQDIDNEVLDGTSVSEALHRAAARVDGSLDQQLATLGLTSRQFLLLKSVALRDGINQMGLTDLTGIDRSTMTDMVGRLIDRGLLSRTKNPRDARAYIVRITDSGRRQMALAMPIVARIDDVVLKGIEPAPRQAFLLTLQAICAVPDRPGP